MVATGDNPIDSAAEDVLGREGAARHLADELRQVDARKGAVVALMGPWGSGKTSMINMVREQLQAEPELPVLDFNPWMFSGAEQLVDAFFTELAAQLRLKSGRLKAFAEEVERYGEVLSPLSVLPVVGAWIGRIGAAGKSLKKFEERRKESVTARRKRLSEKAAELEQSIVVVIDDIDRLNTTEIRDIFKLVRLTASLPNVIYLLAFDRKRVEDALTETGISGRSYLEKIVQIAVDIPSVPEHVLVRQIASELDRALGSLGMEAQYSETRWIDVLAEIIAPLLASMRDVRRYAASVRGTVRALHGQVELVDLLALEAIRIFLPDVFAELSRAQVALTTPAAPLGGRDPLSSEHQQAVEAVMEAASTSKHVAKAVISRLFPAAERFIGGAHYDAGFRKVWLRERRVAHVDILRLYLERFANEGVLAFSDAERAFAVLSDEVALDELLRGIPPERLADVVGALEVYERGFPVEAVPVAIVVLLNLLPDIPEREQCGLYTVSVRSTVMRVVLRLLRHATSLEQVEHMIDEVWTKISSLSSRFYLVLATGHQEHGGSHLVSEEGGRRLEARVLDEIEDTSADELANQRDLARMLIVAEKMRPGVASRMGSLQEPAVVQALLRDAYAETRSQAMGSRAVRRSPRLAWDVLVELYGTEEQLAAAIDRLRDSGPIDAELQARLELADRYRSGWKPPEFGGEDSDDED